MSGIVSGSVSKDFPLYHSEIIPTYQNPNDIQRPHKKHRINSHYYTNEHPDIFRLEGMKEAGYNNPFLDKIAKVDRSENFKKYNTERKNLNFIDFIKCNRKYSQEPKILRYIGDEDKVILSRKRHAFEKEKSVDNSNKYILTEDTNNKDYKKLLIQLNYLTPKIDYRIKRTLELNKSYDNGNNFFNKEKDNNCIYKKINFEIDKNLARNFRNSSVLDIGNRNKENKILDFDFKRKPILQYNPIKDKMEVIHPPSYKN